MFYILKNRRRNAHLVEQYSSNTHHNNIILRCDKVLHAIMNSYGYKNENGVNKSRRDLDNVKVPTDTLGLVEQSDCGWMGKGKRPSSVPLKYFAILFLLSTAVARREFEFPVLIGGCTSVP